ncbi:hypothetical protein [Glaciibacter psychrotolerans]|uniref:Uncharacterized protein n=1 Tax=Glaciibacter psychrotolerans TaxID=670054 RepID=A0A7Z0EFZ1_9MICO|nr:hypothetical protein [Leifsonia psychrotolerans]
MESAYTYVNVATAGSAQLIREHGLWDIAIQITLTRLRSRM